MENFCLNVKLNYTRNPNLHQDRINKINIMNPERKCDRNLNTNKSMKLNILKINNIKYQIRDLPAQAGLIAICF